MKHVKLFEEWTDFLQIQAESSGMTKAEYTAFYLSEGKGQDLADKYVAKLRSEFRKLNDDELDEFKKTIVQSLDLNESVVNEDFPGKGETVKAKDLNYEMLDYFNRMNISLSINTKSKKNIKGSVGTMFNDLVFNGGDIDKKDIVSVKIIESVVNEAALTIPGMAAMLLGLGIATRIGLMSDEKYNKMVGSIIPTAKAIIKTLPIIGNKVRNQELKDYQTKEVEKYLKDEISDKDIVAILNENPKLKKAIEDVATSGLNYKDYYQLIKELGGAANKWGDAHRKFKQLRKKISDGKVLESVITEANGQTVKEFGDLLALLLDEDNGMDIERAIIAMPPKNARVLEKQISTLYKKLFDLTNQGFDLREDSSVVSERRKDWSDPGVDGVAEEFMYAYKSQEDFEGNSLKDWLLDDFGPNAGISRPYFKDFYEEIKDYLERAGYEFEDEY